MRGLKDKWVFITGAAAGIGYETAIAFAQQGANIIATDLQLSTLQRVKKQVEDAGVQIQLFELNVVDSDRFITIIDNLTVQTIEVDILINNAGIGWFGAIEEHTLEKWQQTLDINLMGVVKGTLAFLPQFKKAGTEKHIVNIASLAAVAPAANMSAYATSKYAVMGFTDSLGIECVNTKVGVTCVHPGVINTAIINDQDTGASVSKGQLQQLQTYYQKHGSHPKVVAKDIIKAVKSNQPRLFTGASALSTSILKRLLSTGWMWQISRFLSKKIGYAR